MSDLPSPKEGLDTKCPVEQADTGTFTENGATWWLPTDEALNIDSVVHGGLKV